MSDILIRPRQDTDFQSIWRIFQEVVQGKDTYCDPADTTEAMAHAKWMDPTSDGLIAVCNDNIAGACVIKPNRPGYGAHVANAAFIVDKTYRKQGVGRKLGESALAHAKASGYYSMQFNFVVSTNTRAVALWQSLGFGIIGTIPKGYNHGTLGFVDAYIMYKTL